MEKIEVTVSSSEHEETMFEYLTRIQKNIPTYTQENFLLVLNQLSYITDSYRKTFLFDDNAENQRLKNELDKQIKDNRKLVKALKMYANTEPYVLKEDDWGKQCLDIRKIAKQVLKEVGEEE